MKRSEMQAKAAELQGRFREVALVNPERAFGLGVLCGALLIVLMPILVPVFLTLAALIGVFWLLAEQEEELGREEEVATMTNSSEVHQEPATLELAPVRTESMLKREEGPVPTEMVSDETGDVGASPVNDLNSSDSLAEGAAVEGSFEESFPSSEIESYRPARPEKSSARVSQSFAAHGAGTETERSVESTSKPRKPRKATSKKSQDGKSKDFDTSTQRKGQVKGHSKKPAKKPATARKSK